MVKRLSHSHIILLELAALDFILTFSVLMLSRGLLAGVFPRWYILAATSVVWAVFGILTHKLEFWYFASKGKALWTIVAVDVSLYLLSYLVWKLLFPERGIIVSQLWPLPFIILIECALYYAWQHLFKKLPYLYVDVIEVPYHERGIDNAARYSANEVKSEDLQRIYESTRELEVGAFCDWVRGHRLEFSDSTLVVDSLNCHELKRGSGPYKLIVCLVPFNDLDHFNTFLVKSNALLSDGGTIALHGETSGMRRHRIVASYPPGIGQLVSVADYFWSRVLSKLAVSRRLYMCITKGHNRNFPRVEVLGRIAKAGFDVCGDEVVNDTFYVSAVRRREPVARKPYYGPFIRLPRKGQGGKRIGVFKFRTMYAYSEFIQEYAYKINGLEDGGKLKNDFRVNMIGSFCRSHFLDELPMLINFFRGDLKLVGVRPLSNHYLSLYTPEMQKMHLSVKPGMFPPLYFESTKPSTIEEIQESERKYIEQYRKHPFRTDWKYFWGIMKNVLIKREKSH